MVSVISWIIGKKKDGWMDGLILLHTAKVQCKALDEWV